MIRNKFCAHIVVNILSIENIFYLFNVCNVPVLCILMCSVSCDKICLMFTQHLHSYSTVNELSFEVHLQFIIIFFVFDVTHYCFECTCSEGGFFKAHLTFSKDYPVKPPKMKFVTEIWHPNSELNYFNC